MNQRIKFALLAALFTTSIAPTVSFAQVAIDKQRPIGPRWALHNTDALHIGRAWGILLGTARQKHQGSQQDYKAARTH